MKLKYRVYFNHELEWPQAWSVDEGEQSTEINVCGFVLHCGVTADSHTLPSEEKAKSNRQDKPFAWIEVEGRMEIRQGIAHFTA